MTKPHVLVIPVPAQGHVIPIMELARRLARNGVKVTFVNTEAIHKVVINNLLLEKDDYEDLIHMVSIPDGLEPWEDRGDLIKLTKSILESMPDKLEELVEKINKQDCNKVACIVADGFMGWALRVAKKMGIRTAAFWPAALTSQAINICYEKLIKDGIINNDGIPLNDDMIQLSETMPPIKPKNLPWMCFGDMVTKELLFQHAILIAEGAMLAERVICNSSIEMEPETFNQFPQLLPIGPLLASNRLANQTGHFWQEDSTCIEWLDQQSACSVLYIAFGSIANLNQAQFTELALGLELSHKPFMWVVRTNMVISFPDGYVERVGSRGKIVSWAPQQKVLAHPSVACIMSHCGWNSTIEGVTNGLPFLCWPCFADQFLNETYICDVWKTGLGFSKDDQGIITRGEIKCKVEKLLGDKSFKDKALEIQEKVTSSVRPGGSSHQNLCNFIRWIQEKATTNDHHDRV
ncbi:unnamed protein product [Lactuca virosa]|uniref:UDP-glycosyltransferase n=1 Tax=Lactuca virosa TaxID=75947 RepID=A0AAU9NIH2_9ASTR|nr:unnamed protein product [Lactuca virosa]